MNFKELNNLYCDSSHGTFHENQINRLRNQLSKLKNFSPALLAAAVIPANAEVSSNCLEDPIEVPVNRVSSCVTGYYYLDIDGDGTDDLKLGIVGKTNGTIRWIVDHTAGVENLGLFSNIGYYINAALSSAATIGPTIPPSFDWNSNYQSLYFTNQDTVLGHWLPPHRAFLGVRISVGDDSWKYAWVELEVYEYGMRIYGWACEGDPDRPIIAGSCQEEPVEPIPTVSEWGLITLSLLLLSFGTAVVYRKQMELSNANDASSFTMKLSTPLFHKSSYLGSLAVVLGLGLLLSIFSWLTTGTITLVDIVGGTITAPILAYWIHLVWMFQKRS